MKVNGNITNGYTSALENLAETSRMVACVDCLGLHYQYRLYFIHITFLLVPQKHLQS